MDTGDLVGAGTEAGTDGLMEDFRILSIEKLRFLVVEAGAGRRISEASRTSVGVLGGEDSEEKLEDRTEAGGERLNMSVVSSVLIWWGWSSGKWSGTENMMTSSGKILHSTEQLQLSCSDESISER